MNNKYMLGSLCSIAPIIIHDVEHTWITGHIKICGINNFIAETISINSHQIYKKHDIIYNLALTKVNLSKKVDNLFNNKDDLCLSIFSKISFLKNVFLQYNNLNGLGLLQQHRKLKRYASYSSDIRDYKEKYNIMTLNILLRDLNKIISQSSRCISKHKIQTFQNILQILIGTNISHQSVDKINLVLTNSVAFTKTYNKYIKNMDYYINLGELFKDV